MSEKRAANQVLIISGSVGAGHDGAATELLARLREAGIPADVRDYLHALPRICRTILRRGYTASIRYRPRFFQWLFTSVEDTRWMWAVITVLTVLGRRRVRRWAAGASVVVSTFPFASQTLGQLKSAGRLNVPVVTYLTDPAVHRLWVHPCVDHHVTVTEATAVLGRARYAVPMHAVGGLVGPSFARQHCPRTRSTVRAALGLPQTGPVVLIVAGSEGMGTIASTVDILHRAAVADIIVLCGRNERLRRQLSGLPRVHALGWRRDVADLMAAADVLVHNAGGLSLTEALTVGLPAITFEPIPGHGRVNAQVLARAGLVPWPRDPAGLVAEVLRQYAAGRQDPAALRCQPDASGLVRSLLAPPEPLLVEALPADGPLVGSAQEPGVPVAARRCEVVLR